MAMTRPFAPRALHPASTLLRGSPPLSGASVLSASRLEPLAPFPLASPARFSRSIRQPGRASRCRGSRKTVRKTKTIRKEAAKKAPPRRAARTKVKPTAKVAVKPRPVSQRAQPETVKPPPRRPPQPTAEEQRIGVVTHYYSHLSVVAMQLEPGTTLRVGDIIQIRGHDRFHPEGRVPRG
jgi:hypothetical protein